jgi:asparagine synthase (glutamine-hydrolysing)
MCSIGGFMGRFDAALLRDLNGLQTHRGPDDAGMWHDGASEVGLAHNRLSIIDTSRAGHQPMKSGDGSVVLVFNGEIYNFRELRAELALSGIVFRSQSDTEVVIELYRRCGVSFLHKLNGIFAFALWDTQKRELLVARDALGVKPLYYAVTARGFTFASELKALLPLLDDVHLDVDALHRYLTFLWCPGSGTPLREVRKLLPGEALTVRAGRIASTSTWYRLPAIRGVRADLDEKAAISGTDTALRTAVHRQLVADVPVGAFLSGGLDSSAVVAMAREKIPELRCFTIEAKGGGDAGDTDDLPYARRVARHLGVSLEVVQIESARMAADLENMVRQLDEPLADPAPLNVFYISRLARQSGIKVLLSGAGGDDLFTGYRRHAALNYERLWSWLPRGVLASLGRTTARLDQRQPLFRRAAKLFAGAELRGDDRLASYFKWIQQSQLTALYGPELNEAAVRDAATRPLVEFLARIPDATPRLERLLALEQRFFLPDHNLTYTDKMSMAAGVEVRVPFLDVDLVDHAARIPCRFKQRGRTGKWVLKKAMQPYLPHDVIYRPKSGFGAPLRRWIRGELRELVGDMLSAHSIARRGLFEPQAVRRLILDNEAGRIDAAYTILSLLCIEIWCRAFIDAGSRPARPYAAAGTA